MKWTKLKDFHKIEVKMPDIEKICSKTAEDTVKQLTAVQWVRNRKNRQYSNGWTWGLAVDRDYEITATVYNATDWQLTWLLENGHLVTNAKNTVGWAHPHKHISTAFEDHKDEFVREMKEIDIDVEIS